MSCQEVWWLIAQTMTCSLAPSRQAISMAFLCWQSATQKTARHLCPMAWRACTLLLWISENQTLIPPPTLVVRAIVLSRRFDPQNYTAHLVIRTKIGKPGVLFLPTVTNLQLGTIHPLITLNEQSNVTCPNASVDCVQLWDVAITANSSSCKIEDVLTITWNTTCHYPCWESGKN